MRTSNLILIASTAVLIAASLTYVVLKVVGNGGNQNTAKKDSGRQGSGADSSETGDKDPGSLRDDLAKQKKLLIENDDQINRLTSELKRKNERLIELITLQDNVARELGCKPEALVSNTRQLLVANVQLRQQLQHANLQLSQQIRSPAAGNGNSDKTKPLVEENPEVVKKNPDASGQQAGLNAPENQKMTGVNRKDPSKSTTGSAGNSGAATESATVLFEKNRRLQSKVNELVIELQNREKLLAVQTSWIEDLKQKYGQIETGFRTGPSTTGSSRKGTSTSGDLSPVVRSGPFREVGTYKVPSSR